jgi:hypothetical protein
MVEPTILIIPRHMSPRLVDEIRTACRQARARCVISAEPAAERTSGLVPRVLIARLGQGERRIPSDVLRMLRLWSADASLLLLSEETLTQPTVTLQRGRVTLLGAPVDRRRILHCIRTLLADDQTAMSQASMGSVRLEAQQKLGPRWWASTVLDAAAALVRRSSAAFTLVSDDRTCLTSLIQLDEAPAVTASPDVARAAAETVRQTRQAAACERQLATLTGRGLGVVHLDSENHHWSIYWPRCTGFLRLASQQRLPRVWDLARSFEHQPGRLLTMRAAPADLVVAATASPLPARDEVPDTADAPLAAAAEVDAFVQGGPAVLDWLFERVSRTGFAAVAAEMR